jgi:hypothetical protein
VYPNPTTGILNMELPKNSQVMIHDLNGKLIAEFSSGEILLQLNLSNFENGVYFVTSVSDGVVLNQKVIKH